MPTPENQNPLNMIIPESRIQINEVMANASDDDPVGDSWIELYYPTIEGGQDISSFAANYVLKTGTGVSMQPSTLWETGNENFLLYGPIYLLQYFDSISLVDNNGDIRQVVAWNSPQQDNLSIIPSDPMMVSGPWMPSPYNTPGTYNPGQGNGNQGNGTEDVGLRISEFLPDPIGSDAQTGMDGEWIEITNTGNQIVDLAGWALRSGTGFALPPTSLDPGAFMVYPLGEESMTLTNGQGTLKLNDPEGNSAHTVIWDHSAYGMSMVPGPTTNDTWVIGA